MLLIPCVAPAIGIDALSSDSFELAWIARPSDGLVQSICWRCGMLCWHVPYVLPAPAMLIRCFQCSCTHAQLLAAPGVTPSSLLHASWSKVWWCSLQGIAQCLQRGQGAVMRGGGVCAGCMLGASLWPCTVCVPPGPEPHRHKCELMIRMIHALLTTCSLMPACALCTVQQAPTAARCPLTVLQLAPHCWCACGVRDESRLYALVFCPVLPCAVLCQDRSDRHALQGLLVCEGALPRLLPPCEGVSCLVLGVPAAMTLVYCQRSADSADSALGGLVVGRPLAVFACLEVLC